MGKGANNNERKALELLYEPALNLSKVRQLRRKALEELKYPLSKSDGLSCMWCSKELKIEEAKVGALLQAKFVERPALANYHLSCEICLNLRGGAARPINKWVQLCRASGLNPREELILTKLQGLAALAPDERYRKKITRIIQKLEQDEQQVYSRHKLLVKVFEHYGSQCIWCSKDLEVNIREASFEHIIPKSKGGPNYIENLLPACKSCNAERGDVEAIRWAKYLLSRGQLPRLGVIKGAVEALNHRAP